MSEKKIIPEEELGQNIPVFEKYETSSEESTKPYFNIRNFNRRKKAYQYAAKATLKGTGFFENTREVYPDNLKNQDK